MANEATKIKMRYRGPSVANPDVGAVQDNEVYEVEENLARRLLISEGWKPSGEEAKAWADRQTFAPEPDADAGASGQQAADSGRQEGQDDLGEAQHESEGDPDLAEGERGAGTGPEPGAGVPGDEAPAEGGASNSDGEGS